METRVVLPRQQFRHLYLLVTQDLEEADGVGPTRYFPPFLIGYHDACSKVPQESWDYSDVTDIALFSVGIYFVPEED